MATTETHTFGTTVCRIETHSKIQQYQSSHPCIVIAFVDAKELLLQNGLPVELVGDTEAEAAARMRHFLEKKFGPMEDGLP